MVEGKILRVSMIGAGFGLRTQLPALRAVARIEVVALASGHPTAWDVASFADGVAVQ